ncbi:MAG: FAD-dependent oxidoreductase, partial [Hydrogenophaga sp.]|uniref:NAD(P)/FAD-dependent oxidoreductase n=1 Tax=Hydrogenophaga sp. TaxID=1904254 RepID=UPI0016B170A2
GGTQWMGHRPSTPDSLPVISRSPRDENVLYAFGHGHLGLTQAATTGRLIAELACTQTPSIDLRPFSVTRF